MNKLLRRRLWVAVAVMLIVILCVTASVFQATTPNPVVTASAVGADGGVAATAYNISNYARGGGVARMTAFVTDDKHTITYKGAETNYAVVNNANAKYNASGVAYAGNEYDTASNGYNIYAVSVAAGINFTMVVKSDGSVWGIGKNNRGQLGDGTTTDRKTFVQTLKSDGNPFNNAIQVVCGDEHTVIRCADGTVWAVGDNKKARIGGIKDETEYYTRCINMSDYTSKADSSMAANGYMTVFRVGRGLRVLGMNSEGKIADYWLTGDIDVDNSYLSIAVNRDSNILLSQVEGYKNLSWFESNYNNYRASVIKGGAPFGFGADLSFSYSDSHMYTGRKDMWGAVTSVALANYDPSITHAIVVNGKVHVNGTDRDGMLGILNDKTTGHAYKEPVVQSHPMEDQTTFTNASKVVMNSNSTFVLCEDGKLYVAGVMRTTGAMYNEGNTFAEAEMASEQQSGIRLSSIGNVVDIAVSDTHAVAIMSDGSVMTYGRSNAHGELGVSDSDLSLSMPGFMTCYAKPGEKMILTTTPTETSPLYAHDTLDFATMNTTQIVKPIPVDATVASVRLNNGKIYYFDEVYRAVKFYKTPEISATGPITMKLTADTRYTKSGQKLGFDEE